MVGIYKIENLINGKSYIGQSIDIERRFRAHRTRPFNENDRAYNSYFYRSIRKYGLDNFSFNILEECSVDELNEKEKFYIEKYNSYRNGYNQDEGGTDAQHFTKLNKNKVLEIIEVLKSSYENSDTIGDEFGVTGRVIRAINTGKSCAIDGISYPIRPPLWEIKHNNIKDEIKRPCAICGKLTTNYKYCSSKCYEIGQRKTKRPEPLELARLIKENGFVNTGKMFGVDSNSIKKWCKSYNMPHLKNDLIKWYDSKMGISVNIKPNKESSNEVKKKQVAQIDKESGEIIYMFNNAKDAARSLGKKSYGHICEACNGILNTAYGYIWKYV